MQNHTDCSSGSVVPLAMLILSDYESLIVTGVAGCVRKKWNFPFSENLFCTFAFVHTCSCVDIYSRVHSLIIGERQ